MGICRGKISVQGRCRVRALVRGERVRRDVINSNDRASMIAMGREPEALHACLEATDRRSLREIHRLEFGKFTSAGKPPTRRKEKLNLARPSPKFEKAIEVYDKLK